MRGSLQCLWILLANIFILIKYIWYWYNSDERFRKRINSAPPFCYSPCLVSCLVPHPSHLVKSQSPEHTQSIHRDLSKASVFQFNHGTAAAAVDGGGGLRSRNNSGTRLAEILSWMAIINLLLFHWMTGLTGVHSGGVYYIHTRTFKAGAGRTGDNNSRTRTKGEQSDRLSQEGQFGRLWLTDGCGGRWARTRYSGWGGCTILGWWQRVVTCFLIMKLYITFSRQNFEALFHHRRMQNLHEGLIRGRWKLLRLAFDGDLEHWSGGGPLK